LSTRNVHDFTPAARSLEGHASERWNVERKSLSTISARLTKTTDLDSLRTAFALPSDESLALQRTFGFPNSDQLFKLHCPMAFEGRGASWIQSDDAVHNPYYGATSETSQPPPLD
jgi:Cu(I)/Ag(I) efflux system membrane fusion protein